MENPFEGLPLLDLLRAERELKRAYPVRWWLHKTWDCVKHPLASFRVYQKLRVLRPLLLDDEDFPLGGRRR